jgi:uncharacterized protein YjbJ (UPF0337 family)
MREVRAAKMRRHNINSTSHFGTSGLGARFPCTKQTENSSMHKDQVEGAGKQVKGAVKDQAGKLSGDVGLQAQGKLDKAAGKIQSAVGKAKDDARNDLKH